jgi:two-component system, cell cycle response regulator DivK
MRNASTPRDPFVLLIEPHADTRGMYAEFFAHKGIRLTCVPDAQDALRLAARAAIVITGILLPGEMDGIALVAALRADARTRKTPIIVLTACAWKTERVRAQQAGCDVFLPKPCLPEELLAEVRRLLASTRLTRLRPTPAKVPAPDRRRAASRRTTSRRNRS